MPAILGFYRTKHKLMVGNKIVKLGKKFDNAHYFRHFATAAFARHVATQPERGRATTRDERAEGTRFSARQS